MKNNVKKGIRSAFFVLGFFLLPNVFFLLSMIYSDVAEEDIYQSEFASRLSAEHVNIYLKFKGAPGASEQREVDAIIGKIQTKLHNKKQGKLITHQFDANGVHLKISGENADDLLESALEVLARHEVFPGSFARKIYRAGNSINVDL